MKPNSDRNILIVEDDDALREALCETAQIAGYNAIAAAHGNAALNILSNTDIDLVISDIQMAPLDGNMLLREIRKRDRDLPVVLMTAYGSIQAAVDAMRNGATDYLVKPFEAEVLLGHIDQWVATEKSDTEVGMIVQDKKTKAVVELAKRVAASDVAVMITGESGVGKEEFFRLIHRHSSRAARKPIAINCAAIPENMLEAMLFGHEKGAFTGAYKSCAGKFEQAQGSTLLLDEISEMSFGLQAKLLRVLQERQVERLGSQHLIDLDVRVIATSNCDLKQAVRSGTFREDLYYRLNVFPIHVPALRERRDDIAPLARALLGRATHSAGRSMPAITDAAQARLFAYDWPGNVRELDNVMQRAAIIFAGATVEVDDLVFEDVAVEPLLRADDIEPDSLGDDLKDHERRLILDALDEGRGSRKFASEKLGISPRTLRYKIARMRDEGVAVPSR
ncbi:MAG: sigma-54-dependent Fis family transcriptional regulator [Proteobacteria bacterium]|nr:MAG: sigma-54-dependent Fis family transcriptional regulator [Pseudomonadota bacterium]